MEKKDHPRDAGEGGKAAQGSSRQGVGRGAWGISGFWLLARCMGAPSPDGSWRSGAGLVGRVWGRSGLLEVRVLRTSRGESSMVWVEKVHH